MSLSAACVTGVIRKTSYEALYATPRVSKEADGMQFPGCSKEHLEPVIKCRFDGVPRK